MKTIKRKKNGGHFLIEVLGGYDEVNSGDILVKLGKGNVILNVENKTEDYGIGRVIWDYNVKDKDTVIFKQYLSTPENELEHDDNENSFLLVDGKNYPRNSNPIRRKKNGGVIKIKPLLYGTLGYNQLNVGDEYVYLDLNNAVLNKDSNLICFAYNRIGKVISDENVNNRETIVNVMDEHIKNMSEDDRSKYFNSLQK